MKSETLRPRTLRTHPPAPRAGAAGAGRPASPAREVAVEVLSRVDAGGAFSGALLHRTLERAGLRPLDAALASELTLGTLRHRAEVDWALSQVMRPPLDDVPARIRAVLRTGAYQLMFLDRIPAAAVCSEAVALAKRVGHAGTARLVNGVLRRLAAAPVAVPDGGAPEDIALRESHPRWLVERWTARFGADAARALCRTDNTPPPPSVRLNTLRGAPGDITPRLAGMGLVLAPSRYLPEGARIVRGEPAARRAAYAQGWWSPQDEGAMLVSRALAPRSGETVIDACAGSGGKALHLAALMENRGRVLACDIVPAKLEAVARHAARLGATIVEPRLVDARGAGALVPGGADRVLVDAPCSGLGVLRRRPEIRWRIRPEQLPAFAAAQREILDGAAAAVKPGGTLVFAVCTIEPDEGPAAAAAFLAARPEFEPAPLEAWPPGGAPGARNRAGSPAPPEPVPAGPGAAWLYPHIHDTDGFFIAAFRRRT